VRGGRHPLIGGVVQGVVARHTGQRVEGEDFDGSVAAATGSIEQGEEPLL
jgi:hypothetical protein